MNILERRRQRVKERATPSGLRARHGSGSILRARPMRNGFEVSERAWLGDAPRQVGDARALHDRPARATGGAIQALPASTTDPIGTRRCGSNRQLPSYAASYAVHNALRIRYTFLRDTLN